MYENNITTAHHSNTQCPMCSSTTAGRYVVYDPQGFLADIDTSDLHIICDSCGFDEVETSIHNQYALEDYNWEPAL